MDVSRATEEAEHFRDEAKSCLLVAERMQTLGNRAWLLEMAQHWLEMAIKTEAAERERRCSEGLAGNLLANDFRSTLPEEGSRCRR